MNMEFEHTRKLNAKLKQEKTKALDSHTLFPHVFRQDTMPMYVLKTRIKRRSLIYYLSLSLSEKLILLKLIGVNSY